MIHAPETNLGSKHRRTVLRLSASKRLSQTSTIVGHLNGLPSPPASGGEASPLKTSDMAALEILAKFNERTVLSVGTNQAAKIYQREVFQLACTYPFLQHIVITLTLLHDRHLAGAFGVDRQILSHSYQGTSKFKQVLMRPIKEEAKDALWASAALLGAIQIATFEARTPEEAWPLKPHDPSDLDWLKMSEGKKAVFAIASPLRPGSRFCHISNGHGALFRPMIERRACEREDLVSMTRDFSELFGLGPDSRGGENPYYEAGMALARLLHVQCDGNNIIEFFGFMMHLSTEFKRLLAEKDARALLMIAYWYAKLWRGRWWLQQRGLIEGQAICMFLERFHADDARLQRMLEWPKREFGLETSVVRGGAGSVWCESAATVLCVV
ncbi:hypothetical protein Q7P37_003324 [Cladosporium fusiforme]